MWREEEIEKGTHNIYKTQVTFLPELFYERAAKFIHKSAGKLTVDAKKSQSVKWVSNDGPTLINDN